MNYWLLKNYCLNVVFGIAMHFQRSQVGRTNQDKFRNTKNEWGIRMCKHTLTRRVKLYLGVSNNVFLLQCPLGGAFPPTANVTWPTCNVESCTTYLVRSGYTSTYPLPVAVNKVSQPMWCPMKYSFNRKRYFEKD